MRILYGFNDKKNAIECELVKIDLKEDEAIYTGKTLDGSANITAPIFMWATLFEVFIEDVDGDSHRTAKIYAQTPEKAAAGVDLEPFEVVRHCRFA